MPGHREQNNLIMFRERIMRRIVVLFHFLVVFLFSSVTIYAQQGTDSLLQTATLQNVVQYALKKQPLVEQSLIDEKITELQIKSRLSEWYPQVNFGYLYQHNFKVQTTIIGGNLVRLGVNNTSALQFTA